MRLQLLLLTVAITITSCIKDSEIFVPNKNLGNIQNLLTKLDFNSRIISINPQIDNVIVTDNNEVIFIPANSIINEFNQSVSGNVEFTYSIYTNRVLDIIKDRTLASDLGKINGWINVVLYFRQNQKTVFLKSETGANIKVPYNNTFDNIQLGAFIWQNNIWNNLDGESEVVASNWKLETQNGTIFGTGFSITVKRDGDFLIGATSKYDEEAKICIDLPENHSNQNTVAYMFFAEDKTSYKLIETDYGFCNNKLPIGKLGEIVCLSEQNGKYFIGDNSIITEENILLTMVTKEMSLEEIKKFLAAL